MSKSPEPKRQRTMVTTTNTNNPTYTLLYHANIPGRGEFIRLAFEATATPYDDPANDSPSRAGDVYAACGPSATGDEHGNLLPRCPPMLRVEGVAVAAGRGGGSSSGDGEAAAATATAAAAKEETEPSVLLLSQTANILLWLGPRLGLAGEDANDGEGGGGGGGAEGVDRYFVNQLALEALDLNDEVHDSHHPIASSLYYEDQKEEALRRTRDFRENRLPRYFDYFERVLKANEEKRGSQGRYLVGGKLTYADLTVWQVLDGLRFAFPNELKAREKDYPILFSKFYPGIKEEKNIKDYLESSRRLKYSNGIFRYYPELDRDENVGQG